MSANSWSHRLIRPFARLLVGTRVTPDYLTWLRVITGGIACACFAWGTRGLQMAGGVVWIISALLDRADGELARLSNRNSAEGHRFDTHADIGVSTAMFVAARSGSACATEYSDTGRLPLGCCAASACSSARAGPTTSKTSSSREQS